MHGEGLANLFAVEQQHCLQHQPIAITKRATTNKAVTTIVPILVCEVIHVSKIITTNKKRNSLIQT